MTTLLIQNKLQQQINDLNQYGGLTFEATYNNTMVKGNGRSKQRRGWYWNYQSIEKDMATAKNDMRKMIDNRAYAKGHSMWIYKDAMNSEAAMD